MLMVLIQIVLEDQDITTQLAAGSLQLALQAHNAEILENRELQFLHRRFCHQNTTDFIINH